MAKATGFDFGVTNYAQQAEQGYEFELKAPTTGEGIGVFITVRGELSPAVKRFNKALFNKLQAKDLQRKKRKEEDRIDLDEAEQLQRERAIARIVSWRNVVVDGKELPSTEEAYKEFLSNPDFSWVVEQINEQSNDPTNF